MSDQPPGFPPPPPGFPPPPPPFQPPSQPPSPSSLQTPTSMYPQPGAPGQVPPPYLPTATVGAGINVMSQFGGDAAWSCGLGLVSILVPFFLGRIFYFMPLLGIFYGVRAITRGRMIGGIVGIVLSVIGGLITLLALLGGG